MSLERYVQIDIDDMFVGVQNTRMVTEDVEVRQWWWWLWNDRAFCSEYLENTRCKSKKSLQAVTVVFVCTHKCQLNQLQPLFRFRLVSVSLQTAAAVRAQVVCYIYVLWSHHHQQKLTTLQ